MIFATVFIPQVNELRKRYTSANSVITVNEPQNAETTQDSTYTYSESQHPNKLP